MQITMKILALLLCFVMILGGCTAADGNSTETSDQAAGTAEYQITDAFGNTASLSRDSRIVSCYGSFADCLQLSGIEPVGVTDDAVKEHGLSFSEDVKIIGTVKEINLELLCECDPDYVILSADLAAHIKLEDSLKALGFEYGYFRVDTFSDYASFMESLCAVSGRDDLYRENVALPKENIENILSKIPSDQGAEVLLMRAYSSGIKAKGDDNLAGQILKELGASNIVDKYPSMLEDLSLEQIINDDPEFIFVSFMGSEDAAKEYLQDNFEKSPSFASLSAVKNSNYILLPKDLFHYKPNNRWDESYEYLAKILYPEVFGQ